MSVGSGDAARPSDLGLVEHERDVPATFKGWGPLLFLTISPLFPSVCGDCCS